MKIKIRLIEKIIIIVFLISLIIANIFFIQEFKYKYVNIEELYIINSNINSIVIFDKNQYKYIKIDDRNTIKLIYEKIGKLKVRQKYQNMYMKIYENRKKEKNIYLIIYEENINNNYITIYNKLIIINGKYYVCDIDISKYIKSLSDM